MKKVTLDDKYQIGNGLGAWAKSRDSNLEKGDVRVIGGVLMSVYRIDRHSWSDDEVWWTPVDETYNTFENLRNWVNKL